MWGELYPTIHRGNSTTLIMPTSERGVILSEISEGDTKFLHAEINATRRFRSIVLPTLFTEVLLIVALFIKSRSIIHLDNIHFCIFYQSTNTLDHATVL